MVLGLGHAKVGFCVFGTHNTVADAISRLEYNPKLNSTNDEYNHAMQGVSTKDLAHQKWVWLFIDALVGLMDVVVSKITV